MGRPLLRFVVWIASSSAVALLTATSFIPLLMIQLDDNFDSIFPAIPFAVLLSVLMALRWRDLRSLLMNETSLHSNLSTRLIGVVLIVSLLALRGFTGRFVETAGVSLVATFYGMALIINPLTKKIMFPYVIIYAAGITTPTILEQGLGGELVWISSSFSAKLVWLLGLPVAWTGNHFTLVSRVGDLVAGTVTPGCSSIISITTFLGLLGLMHLDLKKDAYSTVKMAVAGVVVLFTLNALRITALIWIGYYDGGNMLWAIHDWLGYAIFIGFYLATLIVYSRVGHETKSEMRTFGYLSWFHV